MTTLPLRFQARVIPGSGRGRTLRVPTLNLDLRDIPKDLQEGIFACRTFIDGMQYGASAHYGPRPTFDDSPSCEVHLIDASLSSTPERVEVEIVAFLRGIFKFDSSEALTAQMLEDIRKARDILTA